MKKVMLAALAATITATSAFAGPTLGEIERFDKLANKVVATCASVGWIPWVGSNACAGLADKLVARKSTQKVLGPIYGESRKDDIQYTAIITHGTSWWWGGNVSQNGITALVEDARQDVRKHYNIKIKNGKVTHFDACKFPNEVGKHRNKRGGQTLEDGKRYCPSKFQGR